MISIIVPLYNKENCIERTVNSVLSQTYQDFELVIVDDGSTDDSALIVKKINDNRIHYYYKPNGGVSSARNYGINKAVSDWVLFLDADDFLEENALLTLYNCQNRYQSPVVVANFFVEGASGKKLFKSTLDGLVDNPFKEWFFYRFHPRTGNTLIHKSVLEKISYNEHLKRWEDAEFSFNLLSKFPVSYTHEPVLTYTNGYKGLSLPSDKIEHDYVNYLNFKGCSFWHKMCQTVILANCIHRYTAYRGYLVKKYFSYLYLLLLKKILYLFERK